MNDDFRKQIASKISVEEINSLKLWVQTVKDWTAPSSEDLVKLSLLQQMVLMNGFVNDRPARFELLDIAEMAGLPLHEFSMYCEIGNWIAMDRRFSEMSTDDVDEFYEKMDELINAMNEDEEIDDVFAISVESATKRVNEIAELNSLFYEE